jgi:hypothetical protein
MRRTLLIALPVIAVALSSLTAAAQQPFEFFNSYTNMCLQPVNQSTANGAVIVQEPCNGQAAQEWIPYPVGSNMRFMDALSGLCLDARGGAANGTPVQQWTCNGISNERWEQEIDPKSDGGGSVLSRVAGSKSYCLNLPAGQQAAGGAMRIYVCNQTIAGMWHLNVKKGSLFVPNVVGLPLSGANNRVVMYGLQPDPCNTNNKNICNPAKQGIVVEEPGGGVYYQAPKSNVPLYVCEPGSSGTPPTQCP